jgi:hypothetical protein
MIRYETLACVDVVWCGVWTKSSLVQWHVPTVPRGQEGALCSSGQCFRCPVDSSSHAAEWPRKEPWRVTQTNARNERDQNGTAELQTYNFISQTVATKVRSTDWPTYGCDNVMAMIVPRAQLICHGILHSMKGVPPDQQAIKGTYIDCSVPHGEICTHQR